MRENKGITLIALVITIIVLLILAGISIATLTGENGVLTKANTAKKQTEIEDAKEQAKLDIADWIADKIQAGESSDLDDSIVKDILTDKGKEYVKEAKQTSFTTKKNEYEIPYSDLYHSTVSFTLTHINSQFSGNFEVEKGTTWNEFLSEKFHGVPDSWLWLNTRINYERTQEDHEGGGIEANIILGFIYYGGGTTAELGYLRDEDSKIVCLEDEIGSRYL